MKQVFTRLLFFLLLVMQIYQTYAKEPQLTVVFIIDQLSYQQLQQLAPNFRGALRLLLQEGIVYTNAIQPHGMPATATGHAALSTGTYAKDHGWIGNSWFTTQDKYIACDQGPVQKAAVFSPHGLYNYGKSADRLMVDTISDQLILQSTRRTPHTAIALSLKSRSAIGCAGKLGKAIWFDEQTGNFTSSKAYYNQLPEWLLNFNNQKRLDRLRSFTWRLANPKSLIAYHMAQNNNHDYESPINNRVFIDRTHVEPFEQFLQTPYANKLLLDIATQCVKNHTYKGKSGKCLVWISLSSLDKLGHQYGPSGKETIDMLYHLDYQLQEFMRNIRHYAKARDTLFVLTSDHGACPIPELIKHKGINANRIYYPKLIEQMNRMVLDKFGIGNLVEHFKTPGFYLNMKMFKHLAKNKKRAILKELKTFLEQQPGIKKVWSCKKLNKLTFFPDQIESYFKNQLFKGRSGQLIMQTFPFCEPTKTMFGTAHRSPYNYNTHVPLILYQKGDFESKTINSPVTSLQFPNTLSRILNIPKPSASTASLLPGIVPKVKTIYT